MGQKVETPTERGHRGAIDAFLRLQAECQDLGPEAPFHTVNVSELEWHLDEDEDGERFPVQVWVITGRYTEDGGRWHTVH